MRYLSSLFFSFLLYIGLAAQANQAKDILFLRDGSILMGESLGLNVLDHEFILYATSDTVMISNEAVLRKSINAEDRVYYSKGKYHYLQGTNAQFSMGFDLSNVSVSPHLSLSLNKRINKIYSAGLGATYFEIFNRQIAFHRFLSAHLIGRRYLTSIERMARFYLESQIGYSTSLPTFSESDSFKSQGGLFALFGAGTHLPSRGKLKFTFEYDFMAQRFKTRQQFVDENPPSIPVIINTKGFYLRHLFTVRIEIK